MKKVTLYTQIKSVIVNFFLYEPKNAKNHSETPVNRQKPSKSPPVPPQKPLNTSQLMDDIRRGGNVVALDSFEVQHRIQRRTLGIQRRKYSSLCGDVENHVTRLKVLAKRKYVQGDSLTALNLDLMADSLLSHVTYGASSVRSSAQRMNNRQTKV